MRPPAVVPRPRALQALRRLETASLWNGAIRPYSPKAQNDSSNTAPPLMSDPPPDPRPRWMFSTAAFLRVVVVPASLIYSVFYHDFGEEDHVFMPPRRWLQRQTESFFSLSPAEKGIIADAEGAADGERRS